jgi:hypothetical protein
VPTAPLARPEANPDSQPFHPGRVVRKRASKQRPSFS